MTKYFETVRRYSLNPGPEDIDAIVSRFALAGYVVTHLADEPGTWHVKGGKYPYREFGTVRIASPASMESTVLNLDAMKIIEETRGVTFQEEFRRKRAA